MPLGSGRVTLSSFNNRAIMRGLVRVDRRVRPSGRDEESPSTPIRKDGAG
jgi:hypothetical protein